MSEWIDLTTRIDALLRQASESRPAAGLLESMDDLLAEGYLNALAADARSRRLAERVEHLARILDQPQAAAEIRQVALNKRTNDASAAVLRDRLGVLRDHFSRLRALSQAG